MPEKTEFRGENDSKSTKDIYFPFLSWKSLSLKKKGKRYSSFYFINRNTYQFNAWTIKNDFGNMSQSVECRFEP